jgi:hypothetical protein
VDLEVKIDLAQLQQEFNLMTETQLIGVVPDQATKSRLQRYYGEMLKSTNNVPVCHLSPETIVVGA